MPDLDQFTSRDDYYAAVDAWFAAQYPDAENDCE